MEFLLIHLSHFLMGAPDWVPQTKGSLVRTGVNTGDNVAKRWVQGCSSKSTPRGQPLRLGSAVTKRPPLRNDPHTDFQAESVMSCVAGQDRDLSISQDFLTHIPPPGPHATTKVKAQKLRVLGIPSPVMNQLSLSCTTTTIRIQGWIQHSQRDTPNGNAAVPAVGPGSVLPASTN